MATESNPTQGESQGARRVKYGLNVAIATIAALALVVLLNWLVGWSIQNVQPKYRPWLRYDLTATREHSLSPLTLKVLGDINEPYTIVAFLRAPSSSTEAATASVLNRTIDLVQEYGRYNSKITIEQIDPELEITRTNQFYESLQKRYEERLKPIKELVKVGHEAVDDFKRSAKQLAKPVDQALQHPGLTDPRLRTELDTTAKLLSRLDESLQQPLDGVDKIEKDAMPDYASAVRLLDGTLSAINDSIIKSIMATLRRGSESSGTPSEVKEVLLKLIEDLGAIRARVQAASDKLHAAPSASDYDRLREQVGTKRYFLVVMSPTAERVVLLDEMFRAEEDRAKDKEKSEGEDATDIGFLGEEVLTGALASLQIKKQPLIVFVTSGEMPAIGERGSHSYVAERLKKLNFRVEEWSPMPRPSQMGQFVPPAPPPVPEAGQKAVWVVLPLPQPDGRNPMASAGATRVMKLIQERAAAGDGVMCMPLFSPMSALGMTDPMIQFLEPWGLKPQTDRLVLREVQQPKQQTTGTSFLRVTEWPGDLPVTKALAGMPGAIVQGSPIEFDAKAKEKDVKLFPLFVVTGKDLWAEKNLSDDKPLKRDPATAADRYVLAAASESKTGRVVVVTDPIWAANRVAHNADAELREQGMYFADRLGAAYPANSELFVNSVEWLAGLENLIAASPRSQDIRRIGAISPTALFWIKLTLVAGTPIITIVAGIGVWLVRRRG